MLKRWLTGFLLLLCAVSCAPAKTPETAGEGASSENDAPKSDQLSHQIKSAQGAPVAQLSSVLSRIQESGKLRVGTSGNQAPFTMKDKAGNLMGLEIDLAHALSRALEVETEFVQLPFGELLGAVQSGRIDLALSSITMTPKRNMDVAFIGPYFVSGKALLTKDENLSKTEDAAALDKMQARLGAIKGSTSELLIERSAPRATLTTYPNYDEAVQAVVDDKIHALVADLPLVAVTLLQHPDVGFAAVGDPLSFEPIGLAVPADDPHFQNLIGNYLNLLEGLGALEALRARWFGKADWLQKLPGTSLQPLDPGAKFSL